MSERGVFVYVLSDPDLGFAKIGIAKDVSRRHRQLQGGYPMPLSIVFTDYFPNANIGAQVEARAHDILAASRLRGEWFRADPETCIAAIKTAKRAVRNRRGELGWKPTLKRRIDLGRARP